MIYYNSVISLNTLIYDLIILLTLLLNIIFLSYTKFYKYKKKKKKLKLNTLYFFSLSIRNELRSCTMFEAIPSVDLFAWAERAKAYR